MIPATAGCGTQGTPMTISSGSPARKPKPSRSRTQLAAFLRDELKLELSADKTLITHGRTQKARFLGYDLIVQHSPSRPRVNGRIGLRVPNDVVTAKQAPYRRHGTPWHRPHLLNLDDLQIISTYGAEYRGIVQYYLLAGNVFRLHRLRRAAELSMLKTLAAKHRSTVAAMARKYRAVIVTPHGPRTCFEARLERPGRKPLAARFGGIPLKRQAQSGPHRPPAGTPSAPEGDHHPAPARRMRMVPHPHTGGNPPGPQARRPRRPARPRAARLGGPDGENAAQDPHRLRTLPSGHPPREASRELHVKIAGEPDALKGASPVRTGGRPLPRVRAN